MVRFKRERRKFGFLITVRDDKGRFLASRKWSRKFTLQDAKSLFKRNRTLRKNIKRDVLKNVIEIQDTSEKLRLPSERITSRAQVVATAKLRDGRIFSARSFQMDIPFNIESAKQDALDRLNGILTFELLGESNPDEAPDLIARENIRISFSIVYYIKRGK